MHETQRPRRLAAARRIDHCCDRFEEEWSPSHRPAIDKFLLEAPVPDRDELLRCLILLDVELRQAAGEQPARETYLISLPDHRDAVMEIWRRLEHESADRADVRTTNRPVMSGHTTWEREAPPAGSDFAGDPGRGTLAGAVSRVRLNRTRIGLVLLSGLALLLFKPFSSENQQEIGSDTNGNSVEGPATAGHSLSTKTAETPARPLSDVSLSLPPLPPAIAPGQPLSGRVMTRNPTIVDAVVSWTVESIDHRGRIESVRYSPGGDRIASAGADGSLRLWNAASLQLERLLVGHNAEVTAIDWSPGGRYLVSGDREGALLLWDVSESRLLRRLVAHDTPLTSVCWCGTRSEVAAVAADGTLLVCDLSPDVFVRRIAVDGGPLRTVACSRDGQWIACGGDAGTVSIYLADDGSLGATISLKTAVHCIAFSPHESLLAIAAVSGRIAFWNVHKPNAPAVNSGFDTGSASPEVSRVQDIGFSPDGRSLYCGTVDGHLDVWDSSTGGLTDTRVLPDQPVRSFAIAPDDGRILVAAGDSESSLLLIEWADVTKRDNKPFPSSRDGEQVYVTLTEDGTQHVLSPAEFSRRFGAQADRRK